MVRLTCDGSSKDHLSCCCYALVNFSITRKPWDEFCSNFHSMAITLLFVFLTSLAELETRVYDMFHFLNVLHLDYFRYCVHYKTRNKTSSKFITRKL